MAECWESAATHADALVSSAQPLQAHTDNEEEGDCRMDR